MTPRRRALIAGSVVAALALVAILARALAPYDPRVHLDLAAGAQPPSWAHPLGTDLFSRDLLSRLLVGAQLSLGIGALTVLLAVTAGTLVGLLAGWLGGVVDGVLMRTVDALLAVPRIFAVLLVLALWQAGGAMALVLVLAATSWFGTARLVRAEVRSVRHREFVLGLEALGVPPGRVLLRHVVPHVLATVVVTATLGVGQVILLEAGLSYLGVGIRPPTPSWGAIIREGTAALGTAPWIAASAGAALIVTVLALSALGDALRDLLDPRTA